MDRRADPRVELKLPCHIVFPRTKSRLFVGTTENMSRSGILIIWSTDRVITMLPKPGDLLTVDVELPANHSFGRRCMHCQAVVARVSTGETGGPRVAFQVNQMQFRNHANGGFAAAQESDQMSCSLM